VLHILKLVYWAPTQYQNKPLLEFNGYEEWPIAAVIKSCFEIMINLQETRLNIFLASKGEEGHSKMRNSSGFSETMMLAPPKGNALEKGTAAFAPFLHD